MRWLLLCILGLLAGPIGAQTSEVFPGELDLTVTIATPVAEPFAGEMVLVDLHGRYRRHVTRESLVMPDLAGFNWMQLGEDRWYDTRDRGLKVKNFRRRIAVFPDAAGRLTIPSFTHRLTLTDEGDDWFDYDVRSDPVPLTVLPAPQTEGWWFPVSRLEITDRWSNAPDQLKPGDGVLRVVRIEATGASPEMIPPMPELTSPSGMIFAHPEKRLVELSPMGPVAIAYWRWTIRPTNDTSAIVEPVVFDYFDTVTRMPQRAVISAQRIAMEEIATAAPAPERPPARLRPAALAITVALTMAAGLGALAFARGGLFGPGGVPGRDGAHGRGPFDPLRRALRKAGRRGDVAGLRRAAHAIVQRDHVTGGAAARLLASLDRQIFSPTATPPDPRSFAREFLRALDRRTAT